MKKYKVRLGMWPVAKIEPVECERETKDSVWIGSRRGAKRSASGNYFDTWEDAHEALMNAASLRLEVARYNLQRAQGLQDNVKGMVKPEDETP